MGCAGPHPKRPNQSGNHAQKPVFAEENGLMGLQLAPLRTCPLSIPWRVRRVLRSGNRRGSMKEAGGRDGDSDNLAPLWAALMVLIGSSTAPAAKFAVELPFGLLS